MPDDEAPLQAQTPQADDSGDTLPAMAAPPAPVAQEAAPEVAPAAAPLQAQAADSKPITLPPSEPIPTLAPMAPAPTPVAKPTAYESYTQAKEANPFAEDQAFQKAMEEQITKPIDTNIYKGEVTNEPPKKSWWDTLTEPVGTGIHALEGVGGGMAKVYSGVDAVMDAVARNNPVQQWASKVTGNPIPPYVNPEQAYENWLGKKVTEDPAYKGGKVFGEMGSYMAIPGGEGVGLAPWAARTAESAGIGLFSSAGRQMAEKGKINPKELVGDTAFSGALGAAGHGILAAAGKGVKGLMAKGHEAMLPKAKPGEPAGAYSLNLVADEAGKLKGKGYDILKYGKHVDELKAALNDKDFHDLREAYKKIVDAYIIAKHLKNELEVVAKHALSLAKIPTQKARIKISKSRIPTSATAEELAKIKHDLYLEQEAKVEAALRQVHTPETFRAELGKHAEAILDRQMLRDAEHEKQLVGGLKTFQEAADEAEQLQKRWEQARARYDEYRAELRPFLNEIEKKVQAHFGNIERLFIRSEVKHTRSGTVIPVGMGLKHDPFHVQLNEIMQRKYNEMAAAIKAVEGAMHTKIEYGYNSKIKPIQGKVTMAALGLLATAHMQEAEAADNAEGGAGNSKPHGFDPRGALFGAASLGAIILAVKYGPLACKQLQRLPHVYFAHLIGTTKDLLKFTDMHLGKDPEKAEGLVYKIIETGGTIYRAQASSHGEARKVLDVIFGAKPIEDLSEEEKIHAQEALSSIRSLKAYAIKYKREWSKYYKSLEKSDQDIQKLTSKDIKPEHKESLLNMTQEQRLKAKEALSACNGAVNFVCDSFSKERSDNIYDQGFRMLMGNACKVYFYGNPGTMINQAVELGINGPLTLGGKAVIEGYKSVARYSMSSEGRELLGRIHIGGNASQGVSEVTQKAQAFLPEKINGNAALHGSLYNFYNHHPDLMEENGIRSSQDFIHKMLTGNIDADIGQYAFMKAYDDVATTLGYDPLNLYKNAIHRSKTFGKFLKFTDPVERYANLMWTALAEGNYRGVALSLAMMHQVGGRAVIPKEIQTLGWMMDPGTTAKLQAFLDATSLGQQILGDYSGKVDFTFVGFPFLGMAGVGWEDMQSLVANLVTDPAAFFEVVDTAVHHPQRFMGSKKVKHNLEAQRHLRNLINDISILKPTVARIPLQNISAFMYNLPGVLHNQVEFGVQAPGIGKSPFPLKASKVYSFQGANWESARKMLRLKPGPRVTNYQTAEQGLLLGKKTNALTPERKTELNNRRRATGIH